MSDFEDWIGREMRAADRLDAGLAARFTATLMELVAAPRMI